MMDVLRQMAIETGVGAKEKNVLPFHEAFLASIRVGGRINEPMMMVNYKLKSGDLFSDMDMGLDMFLKGKLSLISPQDEGHGFGAEDIREDDGKVIADRCQESNGLALSDGSGGKR